MSRANTGGLQCYQMLSNTRQTGDFALKCVYLLAQFLVCRLLCCKQALVPGPKFLQLLRNQTDIVRRALLMGWNVLLFGLLLKQKIQLETNLLEADVGLFQLMNKKNINQRMTSYTNYKLTYASTVLIESVIMGITRSLPAKDKKSPFVLQFYFTSPAESPFTDVGFSSNCDCAWQL